MAHLTDLRRVEIALFPAWLVNILDCGVSPERRDEDFEKCRGILVAARDEALRGCDDRKQNQILRRVSRVHNALTAEYRRSQARVDKVALICLYALQAVLDADYLELVDGSPLSDAIGAVIEGLDGAFAEARLDASARKQAVKLLAQLQREGYFSGVQIHREVA